MTERQAFATIYLLPYIM